jgi:hypothetical protein
MDRLTEDCVAARKTGLSYGQYMATKHKLKPEQKTKAEPKHDHTRKPFQKLAPGERVCIVCGNKFYTCISHKLCCSKVCSKERNRVTSRERSKRIYRKKCVYGE